MKAMKLTSTIILTVLLMTIISSCSSDVTEGCVVATSLGRYAPGIGGGGNPYFAWSPNGYELAFKAANDQLYVADIGALETDATNVKYYNVESERISSFTWSPDGQSIVYSGWLEGKKTLSIATINKDGSNKRIILDAGSNPIWSPDGQQIVYAQFAEEWPEIFLTDINGENTVRLTESFKPALYGWSPDGAYVLFTSDIDQSDHIYMIEPNDKEAIQLTDEIYCDVDPTWSPDNQHIAFKSNRTGIWNIFIIEIMSKEIRNVAASDKDELQPAWSPDGQKIAYSAFEAISDQDYTLEIYIADIDGNRQVQLTNTTSADESFPLWSPDGKYLAFLVWSDKTWFIDVIDVEVNKRIRLLTMP
jgi:Tol biopolymer transport system component